MRYYADLYLTCLRYKLKSMMEYRADFSISIVAGILQEGSTLLFISVIFANIQQLEGWTFPEMVLTWGLAVAGRGLANTFFDVPMRVNYYVRSGRLDQLLVKPAGILFQMAGESGITLNAIGRGVVGIAAVLIILPELQLPWWSAFYLPLALAGGVLIMVSVQLLMVSLSFWFISVQSMVNTLAWMNIFGQYPISIFAWPLRLLFTWVLPYAMMGFYPAAFLVRGGEYQVYGLLAPLVGVAFLGFALIVWRIGLRHYQSTGS